MGRVALEYGGTLLLPAGGKKNCAKNTENKPHSLPHPRIHRTNEMGVEMAEEGLKVTSRKRTVWKGASIKKEVRPQGGLQCSVPKGGISENACCSGIDGERFRSEKLRSQGEWGRGKEVL